MLQCNIYVNNKHTTHNAICINRIYHNNSNDTTRNI